MTTRLFVSSALGDDRPYPVGSGSLERAPSSWWMATDRPSRTQHRLVSTGIAIASLALAFVPIPGLNQTITVVSGSELQEPLKLLEERFEQQHPNLKLEIKIQGSQDIINNFIDDKNDFTPTVLIPANEEILAQLRDRWTAQHDSEPFHGEPRAIAKTVLVGIAWPDRGKALFPSGRFQWDRLETAMEQRNWQAVGGNPAWGSFDFLMTDPTRSNSGQLTLSLWAQSLQGNRAVERNTFSQPEVESAFALAKRSVYLPPRSTDILLQEFITRGPNEADVATVYESIALYRWQQSAATQNKPYQIYYLDPTIETVSTAAIARRDVGSGAQKAAEQFLDFLTAPEQQQTFVQFGFRPAASDLDITAVPQSPWQQQIPGVEVEIPGRPESPPPPAVLGEVQRLWTRVQ